MNTAVNVDLPTVWSTQPSHPGESLSAAMQRRGVSPETVAELAGVPLETVNDVVSGLGTISPQFAVGLGSVFDGILAQFWANRQFLYDATIKHNEENDELYKPQIPAFKHHFPIPVYNALVDQGYIQWDAPDAERVRAVCEMFEAESLEEICDTQPKKLFRNSPVQAEARGALAAWLWKGEKLAEQRAQQMSSYFDQERLLQATVNLRGLISGSPADALDSIRAELSAAGVIFIALPHIRKCGVRGASWRLDSGHHAVQVNDYGKKADRFWFTLFHEIGHVYNGDGNSLDAEDDNDFSQQDQGQESAADRFAQDLLIPPDDWRSFEHDCPFTRLKITEFAERTGVHAGIVAGRLAKSQKITWRFANQFSSSFELDSPDSVLSDRLRRYQQLSQSLADSQSCSP